MTERKGTRRAPTARTSKDKLLSELLARWETAPPDQRDSIEAVIRAGFEETCAVFVLDMSHFSSTVMRQGILAFLAQIHAMRRAVVPKIEAENGEVVKYVGDDVIAIFPTVQQALAAADSVQRFCSAPPATFIVSIGIGFGPLLHVSRVDIWGHEVNLAFKLGEDTAGPGETLLSEAAYRQLGVASGFERVEVSISGLQVVAHSYRPNANA